MPFSLEIQNFGKLAHATIEIGNLTIFAGPNNTGKSHVSKLLYSLFDAMNANHAKIAIDKLIRPVKADLMFLADCGYENPEAPLSLLTDCIDKMINLVNSTGDDNYANEFEAVANIDPPMRELAIKMNRNFDLIYPSIMKWFRENESSIHHNARELPREISKGILEIYSGITQHSTGDLLLIGVLQKIQSNLSHNFQADISELIKHGNTTAHIRTSRATVFHLGPGSQIGVEPISLRLWRDFSKVVYLESPIYWKLKNALDNARSNPRFFHSQRETLSGVPKYFYDLAMALREQYSGDVEFPEILEKLIRVLGGKITISETGELRFSESGRSLSMHLTATGVANLGILALLIERKVLDKGTFLFIDEPEAHLHPAWQVVMAETLFELARQGVNVVIATHSVDILKWIEVRTKLHPEDKQLIALNHFTPDGVESGEEDFEVKLAGIKKGLTEPFMNMHLKGLGL